MINCLVKKEISLLLFLIVLDIQLSPLIKRDEKKWEKVIFSDETQLYIGPQGQVWVQRHLGEAYNPDYMINQVAHPERVSIWGCFSARGIGDIAIFTENLDSKLLVSILQNKLLPSAARIFKNETWYFLQDNAPVHKSSLVSRWLFNHGIQELEHPPYSPDCNPIENLWNNLKRRVEQRNAKNVEELKVHIKEEWYRTNQDFLQTLSDSMVRRCKEVIKRKGGKIKY